MSDSSPLMHRRRLSLGLSLLLIVACADGGGGGGCGDSGCGGETVPYPGSGAIIDQAAQVRVTPQGFAWIEDNTGPLIEGFLGDEGLSFCLPPTSQTGIQICHIPNASACTDAGTGCLLEGEVSNVSLRPTDGVDGAPDQLDATITLTAIDLAFPVDGFLGRCDDLRVRSDAFDIRTEVVFRIGTDDRLSIELADITPDIGDLDFYHDVEFGEDGFLSCNAWEGAVETLGPLITPFIGDILAQQVEGALCVACESGCPDGASCFGDPEVCRYNGSQECVPLPLGLEGAFDMAGSLAAFGGPEEAVLSYLFYMGNYADSVGSGLSLGAMAGFHGEHNDCVPRRDPPDTSTVPRSSELESGVTPAGGSYMVGVGLAKSALDLAMWSAYNNGTLCLTIGTDQVEQLTSSALSIVLSSLADLTENRNVPIILRVRPTEAPTVRLGSGEVAAGDPPIIVDPLITLEINSLALDFHAYVEERFVRLFTLDTDLAVPLALTPSDDGAAIQLLLGDLEDAFVRVDPVDAELLAEQDVANLATVLPGLIGAFVPQLTAALDEPFAIPAFGGYRLALSQDSFTSIESGQMLAIFANLEEAPADGGPPTLLAAPMATAEIESINGPSAADIVDFESRRRRGDRLDLDRLRTELVLAVDTRLGDEAAEREYSYRIDGGLWHLYRAGARLTIDDAAFLIEGRHTVEVRSREPGRTDTMSLPSAPVEVMIDLASPEVTLRREEGDRVAVEARDSAWPATELSMRWRIEGGDWQVEPHVVAVELPADRAGRVASLEVEVTDPAGRRTLVRREFAIHGRGDREVPSPDNCGSCSSAGGVDAPSVGLWLGLLGLLLWPRRERAGAPPAPGLTALLVVVLAVVALLLAGCSDDPASNTGDAGQTRTCSEGCEPDELCIGDVCVENVCAVDDDCPSTMACTDGRCVTRIRCVNESDCPPGQFCQDDDDDGGSECLSVPCDGNADCGSLPCGGAGLAYCVDSACRCQVPCAEGCGDDQFCCHPTNSCEALPSACEGLTCDVGFAPGIATPASGDPDSCEVTGPECECQELPPLPMGDIGAYLSAGAGPDGTVYLAAFNRTYDDLMFGVVGDDDTVDWTFLDGVPDTGAVTGSLNGPRGGIADPGLRVGRYTSLAVDVGSGVVHISYFDRSQRNLLYARGVPSDGGEFAWKFSRVDETLRSGMYTALTLSSTGVPGIAYFVERAEVEPGVWHAQVRFAWADAADPTAWTVELVDSQRLAAACGGDCTGSTRCNASANACQRTLSSSRCSPRCGGGEQCFDGPDGATCAPVIAGSGLVFLPEGLGLFTDADRLSTDDVALVYYDHTNGQVRYVESSGGTFAEQAPVVLDGDPTTDVGWYPSVTVADGDIVHVTYVDAQNDDLLYYNVNTGERAVIDAGVRGTAENALPILVGDDSSLVVLADGTLQVAYMDSTHHDMLLARRSAEGLWLAPATIAGDETVYEGAYGFYATQLLVDGRTVIVSYRINTREAIRDVVVRTRD